MMTDKIHMTLENNGYKVKFLMDTGATCNVIPYNIVRNMGFGD